jgi:hypothetical protein
MAVTVKAIKLWRCEVDNKPGELARVLGRLAAAGADLQVVMGYRYAGNETKAAIEVFPVVGKKVTAASQGVGLGPTIPALLVEGDNKPGAGHALAETLAGAGINLAFMVAQVIGRRYSAVFGFESEADSRRAASLLKKATSGKKR